MTIFAIWLPFGHSLAGLYAFSTLFGLSYGSFISLAPVCVGQISKASEIGMRFGTSYSLVSFAYVEHLAFNFLPSVSCFSPCLLPVETSKIGPTLTKRPVWRLRTLICIPIGGEMLEKVGSRAMVVFQGSILVLSLFLFVMARWACLSYRWRWRMKI